ncbi:GPR1/FUN34/YaaH family transporter, partial [Actinomadura sp. 6K520]|uniref:acetate uptake transporter n=1 Tax=Actinomadura sp. 6K520 TaxID=2530364 RepID=UPI001042F0BF
MSQAEQEFRTQPTVADPVPLGLAALAVTLFLFSAKNAGWTDGTDAWLGYALAFGGLVQLLAGMWEFRNRDVFWATAFSSYGAFWLGLGLYVVLLAGATDPADQANDLGWIMLAFAILNAYLLLLSTQINQAVLAIFVSLEATLIILFIGNLTTTETTIQIGGYIGVLTALCAWYASAATLLNAMLRQPALTLGKPVLTGLLPHNPNRP